MSSTDCEECKELTSHDDNLLAYQSDSDVPSDLSDDEGPERSDDAEDSEKQSDDEATEIYNEMFGEPSGTGGGDEKTSMPETSEMQLAQYRSPNHRGGSKHRAPGDRAYVKMPSGKKFRITTPKPRIWKCRDRKGNIIPSRLITLHKFGRSRHEYRIIQKELDNTIVSHPNQTFRRYEIVKLQKIINGCLWKKYRHRQDEIKTDKKRKINQRMLFHGSTNISDIVRNGFNEQWSQKNGMFGAGLYFAKHSSKANQYVFGSGKAAICPTHKDICCFQCERKMLACRVTMGRTKFEYTKKAYAHAPVGYDSVTGVPMKAPGGLKYPEYIVYRHEQAYPEYLITYKISM